MQKNKYWTAKAIVGSVIVTITCAVFAAMVRRPMIEFDSTYLDLGACSVGVPVTGSFNIKNSGNSKLCLSRIEANCRCTAVSLEDEVLLPGESTRLDVTMTTHGGTKEAFIFVKSNASNFSTAVLRVGVRDSTRLYPKGQFRKCANENLSVIA